MDAGYRTYKSDLREERAARTRERILDAVLVVMGKDPTGFSVPAVAKEAGVAVPTVYSHFPNKPALIAGIRQRGDRQLRVEDAPRGPTDIGDMVDYLRRFARAYSDVPPETRRLSHTPVMDEFRAANRDKRLAWIEEVFAEPLGALPPEDRAAARDVIVALSSSMGLEALHQYAGLDTDAAVDRVEFAVRRLLGVPKADAPTKRARKKSAKKKSNSAKKKGAKKKKKRGSQ
jgi:AcrR family transcriptional regulator